MLAWGKRCVVHFFRLVQSHGRNNEKSGDWKGNQPRGWLPGKGVRSGWPFRGRTGQLLGRGRGDSRQEGRRDCHSRRLSSHERRRGKGGGAIAPSAKPASYRGVFRF